MRVLNRIWATMKARVVWARGMCPACRRDYRKEAGAWATTCEVCRGFTHDSSIWLRWLRHKPKACCGGHCHKPQVSAEPVVITKVAEPTTVVREE